MPKQVDHEQRRQQIAGALLEVTASHGLEGVSLRQVAAQAGVTSGMVQHYFASKDTMIGFAMRTARTRYEARMTAALEGLGVDAEPRAVVTGLLATMLPVDDQQRQDARTALAFQSYAATRPAVAEGLLTGEAQLRSFLASLLPPPGEAQCSADQREQSATALLGMAEGLGMQVISTGLSAQEALASLEAQVELTFTARTEVAPASATSRGPA